MNFKKKNYFIFLILFLIVSYSYRFQIMYHTSTFFGYDENKAKRYSFIFSDSPFQTSSAKLKNFLIENGKKKKGLK